MSLRIYNTLSRRKEEFEPVSPDKVGIYVCGVTVYDDVHLGHARSAIAFDAIVRYLRYMGYVINHVTNFTDVDDKIINRATELDVDPLDLSGRCIDDLFRDMDRLRIQRATSYPKASENISEIIEFVGKLIERGYAYVSNGDVNFDITKAEDYGKLSGQSLEHMKAGARIEVDESKKNAADFALWKVAKDGEISWDSPWGKGRPGWHIECSVMALKYIGETVDIHGGGSDLIFPHHENEIQQSEAVTGKTFAKYWMHNGLLMIDEEKMSKSLKNFYTIKDLLRSYDPSTIRFFLLNTHYRQPMNYDLDALEEADRSLRRLQNAYRELLDYRGKADGADDAEELSKRALSEFEEKMDDDFNTREALAVVFSLAREANKLNSQKRLSNRGIENIISVMQQVDSVFDMLNRDAEGGESELLEKLMKLILDIREDARKKKDYATSDAIRDGLKEIGIEIQDSSDGPKWKMTG